ncbi:helix-turn-helix transcriptional regulator [Methylomonas albis]|uniref:HTH luxR-type domain-containing protein n=1 Tax=Methylomonas albis TaxID=1854563 RepID=A0ABR9D1R1_9GAMM|nr:helix-turn-helix transcriptional regulator [Methylomonas albis]MBD9356154.1 hypothetical protein [Methylomonas albis]
MKRSQALCYLRQLCCSGLGKELVIGEFLRTLPSLVPSVSNVFSGVNEHLRPTYCITDFDGSDMAGTMVEVVSSFYNPERLSRAVSWLKAHPAITSPLILDEHFYSTDMYNVVYSRFDMHHVLWMPTLCVGKPNGILRLYRPKTHKPFDRNDQVLVSQLLPYLTHALRAVNDDRPSYNKEATSGMIIMNAHGRLLFMSPEAKKLLNLAYSPTLTEHHDSEKDVLMARLAQLCRDLKVIYRGQNAAPPNYRHVGANGQFLFRAYWLDQENSDAEGLVGLTIEHREPLKLKVLRCMQQIPLSPTQKDVAMLLSQGVSFEQIGQRLNIKPTTVKDHVGKIYTKLDIHQRDEVLPRLLALAS